MKKLTFNLKKHADSEIFAILLFNLQQQVVEFSVEYDDGFAILTIA